MKYSEVYEEILDLEPKNIIVTGCQRSGTQIAARIIAYDFGFEYVDETQIGTDEEMKLLYQLNTRDELVIQCPALSHAVHRIAEIADGITLIVFMVRDAEEILASMRRIGWDNHEVERAKYEREFEIYSDDPIPILKETIWDEVQRWVLADCLDLDYDSLAGHELFVPLEKRKEFGERQWKVER